MLVPSGLEFQERDLHLLPLMAECGFVKRSEVPFTLKSGIKSHVYVFGREDLTDNPVLEHFVGKKIAHEVWDYEDKAFEDRLRQPCLIGIPTAGTVLAQAASSADLVDTDLSGDDVICHRLMREVKKGHGAHLTWVNGRPDIVKHSYWIVDNVATNGQSKIEAAQKLEEDGYPAKEMPILIFIDRQQGAVARLKKAGFKHIVVCYNLLDITFAFGELGLWPKETVKLVEDEIAAHQFLTD